MQRGRYDNKTISRGELARRRTHVSYRRHAHGGPSPEIKYNSYQTYGRQSWVPSNAFAGSLPPAKFALPRRTGEPLHDSMGSEERDLPVPMWFYCCIVLIISSQRSSIELPTVTLTSSSLVIGRRRLGLKLSPFIEAVHLQYVPWSKVGGAIGSRRKLQKWCTPAIV